LARVTRVKCDVDGLVAKIQQVGTRAVKGISTVMRNYGELILHQAERNAPHDTGSLEKALDIHYTPTGINRRLVVTIFVKTDEPYIDPNSNHKVSQKTVGDYALLMERYLRPYGAGGYKARKGTRDKGAQAGGKFLQRAVKRYRMELIQRARQIARRAAQR
jgi:hypothetical protein